MFKKSAQLNIQVNETAGPPQKKVVKSQQEQLIEGVRLTTAEQQYLLPHFMMMLVGKPGSGKTSVIKQLLNDKGFYYQKFDDVLLISPSATKMDIRVRKENLTQLFNLKWIEQRLFDINLKQKNRILQRLRELNMIDKFDLDRLNGKLNDDISMYLKDKASQQQSTQPTPNLYQDKERFFNKNMFKQEAIQKAPTSQVKKSKVQQQQEESKNVDLSQYVDELHKKYVTKLPVADANKLYHNVLIVLDDMVSQIKASEFDPLLTQLIFNRRHLILNGMISIVIVSQKYTMIPARVRSGANWLVMFRQNPKDFDSVYKDVVMMHQQQWDQLLEFVYGGVEKKYNNLGIWIEQDQFFLNFKPLQLEGASTKQSTKMIDFDNEKL